MLPSTPYLLLRPANVVAAVGNPFTLDGTPQHANATSASLPLPAFSTTFGNDIVYVAVVSNSTPTGVTGGGLTFTSRISVNNGGGSTIQIYSAPASSPLSSVVFTCTSSVSAFFSAGVFAFSGAHFASPFDANGAIPASTTGSTALTFTTSNANDILIAAGVTNSNLDAPYTTIINTGVDFLVAGYQIVSATQSGSTATFGGGNAGSVGDAIIKGP